MGDVRLCVCLVVSMYMICLFVCLFICMCIQAFLLIMGLWANIGYEGGLGIIFSVVTLLGSTFALVSFFVADNADIALNLNIGIGSK